MGASRTCVLFVTIHLLSMITAQEVEKRGPQGFLGMRGKKFDSTEQFYKRKPQFFVGVKGKKTLYDIMDPGVGYYKRAPMGFVGMRGKKDSSDEYPETFEFDPKQGSLIGEINYSANNKDVGEFPLLSELLRAYISKMERAPSAEQSSELGEDERMTNEIEKRAANMHQFYGVRGKKSVDKRLADVSFRGKFIGVRGKKDLKNNPAQEIRFLLDNGPLPKRKGQMGFIGMRGKKWTDDSSPEMDIPN